MGNIFTITNLHCSYKNNGHAILFIPELAIPKGKLTVILGRSGSGKSTLIEALGLMNKTIQEKNTVKYFSPEGEFDLAELWSKKKKICKIRKDYFSFIFQDDYLMPHYNCNENVLMANLIHSSISEEKAKDIIKGPMESLDLKDSKLLKRFPYEVAGGQKQRLSFIRAVIKEFDVLFGDEPTGNLDYKSSKKLFRFIKGIIKQKNSTAVIVSHNIELSVEEADKIIVLTQVGDQENSPFVMKKENEFTRRDGNDKWDKYPDNEQDLVRYIQEIL
jgi:putative ABC transport system ATP-binding protein